MLFWRQQFIITDFFIFHTKQNTPNMSRIWPHVTFGSCSSWAESQTEFFGSWPKKINFFGILWPVTAQWHEKLCLRHLAHTLYCEQFFVCSFEQTNIAFIIVLTRKKKLTKDPTKRQKYQARRTPVWRFFLIPKICQKTVVITSNDPFWSRKVTFRPKASVSEPKNGAINPADWSGNSSSKLIT